MSFTKNIQSAISESILKLYQLEVATTDINLTPTRAEFDGDITYIVFPLVRELKKKPEDIAHEIGTDITASNESIKAYTVVKGFLNVSLTDAFWLGQLAGIEGENNYGTFPKRDKKVLVEFSSPNTNKPLHLGHIRNILLGWSSSMLLEAAGYDVLKTQIINDRGIAICKSMVAWGEFGEGKTPESTSTKGDHFIGEYYVLFETKFKEEYLAWQATDEANATYAEHKKPEQTADGFYKAYKNQYFNNFSALGAKATDLLIKWEENDTDVKALWSKMNSWVYKGFDETYSDLGVSFDDLYYESDTYLLGKDNIEQGLKDGTFYSKEDGSVWIDLEDVGLDHKLVLRSNGTSVYMTQDIGTAQIRYDDHKTEKMLYVVADEQDYHFKVLFEIMKKLKAPFADGLHHLSYGMVDLPTGRMKSREGTVVDADDLIAEVIGEVKKQASERGELEETTEEERAEIYRKIGLSALKFFILKVNPKKRMIFNPEESVDMQGQTGPYIQNAYVRIQSILRRWETMKDNVTADKEVDVLHEQESGLIQTLVAYPQEVLLSAENYDPSGMASYLYNLAKDYHKFYHDVRILTAESPEAMLLRIRLCESVAMVLKSGMKLLGIEMPERM